MGARPYQTKFKNDIYAAWSSGAKNVVGVAPTGSGKTFVMSEIIHEHDGPCIASAHRQELVGQISIAVARNQVRHRIIGPSAVAKECVQLHMMELGRNYVDPNARVAVAGVDTLVRMNGADPWFRSVTLGIQDEAHHMLRSNKWGKSAAMFQQARWLGVTATPNRADGLGLGAHAEGIFDAMVLAPSMRDLINMGYLTDYRIFTVPSDVDLTNVPTSAGGDFSPEPLRQAVHRSHIVGDVVQHYLRIAPGKLGVTFAVDVDSARGIAGAFNAAGTKAEVVTADTPARERVLALRRFRTRQILQLINVDLFGEGFDLPAIEVVSFARPTKSFPLFIQQIGRVLRVMVGEEYWRYWDAYSDADRRLIIAASSKPRGIVIDHVGNVGRHGLPDKFREFSLNGRQKNEKVLVIPVRTCGMCGITYESINLVCPDCKTPPIVVARSAPELVDGDLTELDDQTLAKMRGEIDKPLTFPWSAHPGIVSNLVNQHKLRREAQEALRAAMKQWAGYRTQDQDFRSDEVRRAMKEFFFTFGIDVMSAQALPRAEAEALRKRIEGAM